MLEVMAKSPQMFNPIPDNCKLFLPLWHDELRGGVFSSADDFRHVCTVTGTTWGSTGRTFNGSSAKIVIASNAAWQNLTSKSVIIWYKAPGFTGTYRQLYNGYFGTAPYGDEIWFRYDANWGRIQVKNTAGDAEYGEWTHVPDTWTMLSYSWNGTNIRFWKDVTELTGVLHGGVFGGTMACSTGGLMLGVLLATLWFGGIIGEVRVYNRALSQAEITSIYDETKFRFP